MTTNNDEVLAAAERLRKVVAIDVGSDTPKYTGLLMDIYETQYADDAYADLAYDREICSDAYLAHLDAQAKREAERVEAVSMDWWLSLGAKSKDGWDGYWIGPVRLWIYSANGHQLSVGENCVWSGKGLARGRVFDLLAGLGIEPAKGGGA